MNMSYCRFYNTNNDLQDCMNALEEMGAISESFKYAEGNEEMVEELRDEYGEDWGLSEMERRAAKEMIENFLQFASDMDWCDSVNYDEIDTFIESISE